MSFIAVGIGAGASVLGGIFGAVSAGKAKRDAEAKEKVARAEMNRLKDVYSNLDTSNPYLNMENVMEDLTINQQQAQFERESFQQSQANIMGGLRGAAGSSGIAALAQSLAQQGQIAAQRSSASIGQQEAANIRAERQMAGQIQAQERQGDLISRQMEERKQSTLLGMSQQETAAYSQQAAMAQQAKWDAISSGIGGITDMAGSYLGAQGS